MRLVVKGKFESTDQLPVAQLPDNAVVFDEPDDVDGIARMSFKYTIGSLILVIAIFIIGTVFGAGGGFDIVNQWGPMLLGVLFSVLFIPAHEMIHAALLPRTAVAELWWSIPNGMFFIATSSPMTKLRFIVMSLMPNIILGWIPLLFWMLFPMGDAQATYLFTFGALMALSGAGDYLNVFNALRQMPDGSVQQMSGLHSYWYVPSDAPHHTAAH